MQSRFIVNIILFLTVIALTSYLYIEKNSTISASETLTEINPEEISTINIKHNDRVILLKKVNDTWTMVKPIKIAADSFRVDSVLGLLTTTSHGKYFIDDLDPDKYGLSQPATSIRFDDIEINFGIVNPVNNYRYVNTRENMHLIDDYFYPLLSSQVGTLIARNLLPADTKIKKIVLPELELKRDENEKWTSNHNISADAIIETINNWKKSQAFGVHNYMKRKSLGDINVYLQDQDKPIHFEITATEPWFIIARPELDIEYHFNLEFYNTLVHPWEKTETPDQHETLTVQPEEFLNSIQQ